MLSMASMSTVTTFGRFNMFFRYYARSLGYVLQSKILWEHNDRLISLANFVREND